MAAAADRAWNARRGTGLNSNGRAMAGSNAGLVAPTEATGAAGANGCRCTWSPDDVLRQTSSHGSVMTTASATTVNAISRRRPSDRRPDGTSTVGRAPGMTDPGDQRSSLETTALGTWCCTTSLA